MSTGKKYLKCRCPHCSAEVSYPDYAGGGASPCGKCGGIVLLPRAASVPQTASAAPVVMKPAVAPSPAPVPAAKPSPPPVAKPAPADVKRVEPSAIRPADTGGAQPARRTFPRVCLWALNCAIVIAVVIVVGSHLKNRSQPLDDEGSSTPPPSADSKAHVPAAPVPVANPPAPPPASPAPPSAASAPPASSPPAPGTPKAPKLIGDLKVTQVALDQPKGAKGSRLVYVTGMLKNDSDQQRFGVRVELDLLDAAGNKVGTATDYRQMLDPRATWQFRAIVTDRRATGAKLTGVKEDE